MRLFIQQYVHLEHVANDVEKMTVIVCSTNYWLDNNHQQSFLNSVVVYELVGQVQNVFIGCAFLFASCIQVWPSGIYSTRLAKSRQLRWLNIEKLFLRVKSAFPASSERRAI